jgi:flavin-dependent dehydrogenase
MMNVEPQKLNQHHAYTSTFHILRFDILHSYFKHLRSGSSQPAEPSRPRKEQFPAGRCFPCETRSSSCILFPMKIGIIGARVAGSYAGLLLSRMGHEVLLFDDSIEKHKPCGGGLTFKVLRKMPWLHKHSLPHTVVETVHFTTPDGYASTLKLPHPIYVFPRFSLDTFLLQCAIQEGARFLPERVKNFENDKSGWAIRSSGGAYEVDYLIGADGVNSSVRASLLAPFPASDLVLALGYRLPGLSEPGTIRIAYQERGFIGYLWSFPCADYASVGIGRWLPGTRSADLRRRVDEFVAAHYPGAGSGKEFYAALIPCLSRKSLIQQRVCGEKWALLGDAAGFTDGVTAEGIYYALRSAELLADTIQRGSPLAYESAWRSEFEPDLMTSAIWRDIFYCSSVLSQSFIRRSLQAVRHSRLIQKMLDDLICGKITYRTVFWTLVLRSPQILAQAFWHKYVGVTNDELRMTNDE